MSRSTSEKKVSEPRPPDIRDWLTRLYQMKDIDETSLHQMYEAFAYQGFNRDEVLLQLRTQIPDENIAVQLIVVTAMRGPQAASRIKLLNGRTPLDMGIPASGGQGTKKLTLNKILSATADIAAHFLKRMNIQKRVNVELPGWLQFPSAGSIKLPAIYREQHREFSRRFSELIGGQFQESIYTQMEINAYLDPGLRLFE